VPPPTRSRTEAAPEERRDRLIGIGARRDQWLARDADPQPGEVVLLSPACASFDQFRDYEERGDAFRSLIPRG